MNKGRLNSKIFVGEQQWSTVPKVQASQEPEAIPAQAVPSVMGHSPIRSEHSKQREMLVAWSITAPDTASSEPGPGSMQEQKETELGLETSWNIHLGDPSRRKATYSGGP